MQGDKRPKESRPVTAAEMFHRLHQFVKNYDADGQADLFAETGVWEFPLATGTIPRRLEGRENIRAFGKAGMERSKSAGRRIIGYRSMVIHETLDPNTVIVEFELEGEVVAKGEKYVIPYIQVLRVMNGEIVLLRDYFSVESLQAILQLEEQIQ